MKILITGGCGFIGSNLVRYLLADTEHQVINLDKLTYAANLATLAEIPEDKHYKFVLGDICDTALLDRLFAEEKIDTVVHFAAESHVDRSIEGPSAFIQTNIIGTFTLLEAARKFWLSTGNRQKLEGYLAHKSGLTANLPADHPYKTTPPTV